jgi:predicted N-acetyltransferase YhbS
VSPDWRGLGLGRRLVRAVLEVARRERRRVLCVTLEPRFFVRLGFRPVPLAALPAKPERAAVVDGRPRVALAWDPPSAPAPVPAAVTS